MQKDNKCIKMTQTRLYIKIATLSAQCSDFTERGLIVDLML